MLNREYDPVKGLWNGVGGKIEKGETPLENAIREIKEETNIVVEGILDWKAISWILSDYNYGVGEIIPKFLSEILHNELILEHNFVLSNHKLIDYRNAELIKQDSSIDKIVQL
ncbi:MutT/Nudix [Bacillus cereus]|nr:MutT/Nudix [Bacillus cereus]